MNKAHRYGLLLIILMVIAPHASHLPLWVTALCSALLLWRGYLVWSDNPLPKRGLLITLTLASLVGILADFHTLFGREVGVTLLMLLSTLKLMELRTARDAMALIYLACFIIITNFLYSQSLPTALYMLATLMLIMSTWVHLHAPRIATKARLRIAAILLLQAIPLTLILFILFPRMQGPLWGLPQDAFARSGLDDSMSPGSMGRLVLSDAVAFRVSYAGKAPVRAQMYWRGPVLWNFDGSTWTADRAAYTVPPELSVTGAAIEYTVTLEAHSKFWLFALEMPERLSIPARLTHDFQLLNPEPVNERLRYEARSRLAFHANLHESPAQLQRALQLPRALNPRTRELAANWRAESADDEKIIRRALANFNRQNFYYTLEPPLLGRNGIDDFMFSTRRGFCEHYASAFVFLMRAAGIPARVVTGYQGGEYNAYGNYYIVRQSDAHAWAEVWLQEQGWVRIDPTAAIAPERVEQGLSAALTDSATLPFMSRNPPLWLRNLRLNWDALANEWNNRVLGYDSERQFAYLSSLGMASIRAQLIYMAAGVGLIVALFALYMLRHLFRHETDKTQAAWLKLCRKLARAGLPRAPHEGPWDYALRAGAALPALEASLHDLAARYITLRYGRTRDEGAQQEFIRRVARFPSFRFARR